MKYLNLSYCNIDTLPPEIVNLTNLTKLILYDNDLTSLPPEIVNLTNLTVLDLRYNQLTSLPPEIVNLTNLTVLDLENNQLSSLPPEIGNLKNLQSLNLSFNDLTSLPPEIGNLTNLTTLSLSISTDSDNKQIFSLLSKLPNLKSLILYIKDLTSLPQEIGNLTNLTELYLDWEEIDSLPDEILNLNCFSSDDWYYMSQIFAKNKDFENAQLVCKKAIQKDPDYYSYYFNLSWYSLFVGKPEEAITAAQKSLELAPEKTGVYTNLALGYVLNNQFDKAKPIYLEWKDKHFPNDYRTCKEVFLQDIADLEAAGIHHKDFDKVRELLR